MNAGRNRALRSMQALRDTLLLALFLALLRLLPHSSLLSAKKGPTPSSNDLLAFCSFSFWPFGFPLSSRDDRTLPASSTFSFACAVR